MPNQYTQKELIFIDDSLMMDEDTDDYNIFSYYYKE